MDNSSSNNSKDLEEVPLEKLPVEKEGILESFVDSFSDLALVIDEEGRFAEVFTPSHDLLYAPRKEVIGKRVDEVLPEKVGNYFLEALQNTIDSGELQRLEYSLKIDGETHWFEAWINPYPVKEGTRTLVPTSIRDITEEKEAKQELKRKELTIESSLAGIGITNLEGEIEYVNPAALNLWGYEDEDKMVGHHAAEFWANEEKVKEVLGSVREAGKWRGELTGKKEDGTTFYARVFASPVTDEQGNQLAITSSFIDITERKRTRQALTEERTKLINLHDAVDELQGQDTEEDILRTVVEAAETTLGFEICAIRTLKGGYLLPRASSAELDSEEMSKLEVGEGVAGKTAQRGETIWGNDLGNHPEAKPTNGEFRSFISVPIGGLGVFQVYSREAGTFSQREVKLAEILANHLNEELQRIRLEEDLKERAIRDPLTGLYNRRYFNETLKKEVQQAERYDKPLAFLMADVDRFKEVNDRYSHRIGDQVLKKVADLLRENFRDADTVVRYGGDEFLVMMPETDGGATETVDRLNEELDRWNEETELLDFPLTLAIGISHWSPDQNRGVEEALKEADRKMYEDKKGR